MTKPKRILIIAPYGFNDRMTNFIEFVSGRLLAKNGWTVLALTRSENGRDSVVETCGITVYRYKSTRSGIRSLVSILFRGRPALFHIHNLRNNRLGIVSALCARFLRIPFAFTEYGLLHDHYLTPDREDPLSSPMYPDQVIKSLRGLCRSIVKNPKRWKYYASSYFFHWPLAHADSIVFLSAHNMPIADTLGLPTHIHLPQIIDERWQPYKVDADAKLDEYEKEVLGTISKVRTTAALFIGQIKLRKGWDVLVRAIPYIPENVIARFILKTSTRGEESGEYRELVDSLGVRGRIVYLDRVFGNDVLRKVYEASTLVVVPSRYEGFGLVPLEAFEMNKPVVASRAPALTDFLSDGENALLVPPKDPQALAQAIVALALDKALQEKLIEGGHATLRKLRSKEYEQKWLEYYSRFL